MNRSIVISGLLGMLSLAACDRPTTVYVPGPAVAVPGPAGPQGEAGMQGATGYQGNQGNEGMQGAAGKTGIPGEMGQTGETGKTGENTTIIVTPPVAPTPAN
jgi:hypothetical protein